MSKQVILSLGAGNLQQGFPKVTAQLRATPTAAVRQCEGSLPPATELQAVYRRWWALYELLLRIRFPAGRRIQIIEEEDLSHFSQPEFEDLSDKLVQLLNEWLSTPGFTSLYTQLTPWLSVEDEIEVILDVNDGEQQLARLPWQEWTFFDTYPKAYLSFSLTKFGPLEQRQRKVAGEVRILAILGDSENINIEVDKTQLEAVVGSKVTFLEQPSHQEFFAALASPAGWDILFFAGHSHTEKGEGFLQINPTQKITLKKLKFGLKESMKNGLHLAIFNSCDGLGLAQALAELEMPNVIVMRDTVPDLIAQTFLKRFLDQFSEGSSIGLSVREAQGWLQGMADYLHRAGWLPVLYRNPAVPSLSWQELQSARGGVDTSSDDGPNHSNASWSMALLSSLMTLGLVLTIRALGGLQGLELKAFDQLMQLRPAEAVDERYLVITIDEADIQAQKKMNFQEPRTESSLSDQALHQLLKKLTPYDPSVIGLDIYHDAPFDPSLTPFLANDAVPFIASCLVYRTSEEKGAAAIAAPDGLSKEKLGFTDWPIDPDGKIRRHLLGMSPDDGCPTSQSLSLRVSLTYLETMHGLVIEQEGRVRRIGSIWLNRLTGNSGGYQLPPLEAAGYQLLINYRAQSAQHIPLREILNGSRESDLARLVPGRIILIGRGRADKKIDHHPTPYSRSNLPNEAGVFIHAQMSSQLLSAALDGRPLIWWWPEIAENIWIGIWSLVGSCLVVIGLPAHWRGLGFIFGSLALFGSCFLIFLQGGWIPLIPAGAVFLLSGGSMATYKKLTH